MDSAPEGSADVPRSSSTSGTSQNAEIGASSSANSQIAGAALPPLPPRMTTRGRSSRNQSGAHTAPESSTTLANAPTIPGIGMQTPVPPFVSSGSNNPREDEESDSTESEDPLNLKEVASLNEEIKDLQAKLIQKGDDVDQLWRVNQNILENYWALETRYKTLQSYKPIPKRPVTILSAEQIQDRQRRQSTAESTQRIRTALVAKEGLPGVSMFIAPQTHPSPYREPSQLGTLRIPAGVEGYNASTAPNTVSIQLPIGVTASSTLPGAPSGSSTSQPRVNPQASTGNNPLDRSSTSSQVGVSSQVGINHDPLGANPLGSGSDLSQLCINPLPLVSDSNPPQVVDTRQADPSVREIYAAFPGLIGHSSSSSFFNREVVLTAYQQRFGTDAPTADLTTEQMALRLSVEEPPRDTSQLSEAEFDLSEDDDMTLSNTQNTSVTELRDRYESRLEKRRRKEKRLMFELKEARRELARRDPVIVHTAKDMKILRSLNCVQKAVDYLAQDVLSLLDKSFAAQWPGVQLNPPWREWTNIQLLSTLKVMFSVDNNYQTQPFLDRIGALRLTVDPKNPNVLNSSLLKLSSIITETPPEIVAKEQAAAVITLVKQTLYKSPKQVDKTIAKDLGALQPEKLPKTLDEFQVRLIREAGNATTKIADAVRYLSGRSDQEHGQSPIPSGGGSEKPSRREKRKRDFLSGKILMISALDRLLAQCAVVETMTSRLACS